MMYEQGKSDGPIVPAKPSNKADDGRLDSVHPTSSAAEGAKGRGPVKGNPPGQTTHRTQGRDGVQNALSRVRQVAGKDKRLRFTRFVGDVHVDHSSGINPCSRRKAAMRVKVGSKAGCVTGQVGP
jgi:RNA-directed DNA polymerase